MEIILTAANPQDEIHIRTEWSEYRFWLTDPCRCLGILSGGVLGQCHREAYLAGLIYPPAEHITVSEKLEIGACASFFIEGSHWMNLEAPPWPPVEAVPRPPTPVKTPDARPDVTPDGSKVGAARTDVKAKNKN